MPASPSMDVVRLPRVSIITVCFNAEKTIRETIDSVLQQQYENLEYIIIDGASTDGTLEILREYGDENIKVTSEPDNGIYFAMNKGIKWSTGELIGIINADDFYHPNVIKNVVSLWMDSGKPNIISGLTTILDFDGESQDIYAKPIIDKRNNYINIPHPSTFVSASAYDRFGGFDTSFRYAGDKELFYRMISGGASIVVHELVVSSFRQNGLGSSIGLLAQNENFSIDRKYRGYLTAIFCYFNSVCYAYSIRLKDLFNQFIAYCRLRMRLR